MSAEADSPLCLAWLGHVRSVLLHLADGQAAACPIPPHNCGRPQGLDQVVFAQSLPFTLPGGPKFQLLAFFPTGFRRTDNGRIERRCSSPF